MSEFQLKEKKTLSEKAYEKLKELIIDGTLEKGSKITETSIAKMFGISPTPIREAFRKLSAEGLIEVNSWKGVIIKGIGKKDLLEIYECREALEGMAGYLASNNITDRDITELEEIIIESDNVKEIKELIKLNTQFHDKILEIANNERLKRLLSDLMGVILYDRDISNRYTTRREEILEEHKEILKYLKMRDAEKVSMLMKEHVRHGYIFIKNKRDK
ncbi:GntR family transcriptional regulator [Fusobacterium perfoetens]|uniref:GntR family transcriptional regulator n=1 Tax=Fusobacterium perfoetens TaxID=852 RepID=UPI000483E501|nr:GntR family transcriptional regulator [Fusobacterium perfoetens]MCI6152181.1 GntR family transcriptional regulator [Fusobacterium perfoetens]MDY3237928.1 GntR family transcriptional regulator [Fusobacterium perfoetens]